MQKLLLGALICTTAALRSADATTFYAVEFDQSALLYNQLVSISDASPTVTPLGTLGNGSLDFRGGMAAGPGGALYGIAYHVPFTDPDSLYRIQPDGTITLAGSLGLPNGHFTALTYDPANGLFYGLAEGLDPQLYSIQLNGAGMVSSVTAVEPGFGFSGITYDTANGTFWGIADNDVLWRFDLLGGATLMGVSVAFGDDFTSLAYDPVNNAFWTLETPTPFIFHQAGLIQISPAGVSSPAYSLSQNFATSLTELTLAPDATPPSRTDAPEPAISATLGAGLILIGLSRFWVRRRAKSPMERGRV